MQIASLRKRSHILVKCWKVADWFCTNRVTREKLCCWKVVDWFCTRRVTRVELWCWKVVGWCCTRRVTRVELRVRGQQVESIHEGYSHPSQSTNQYRRLLNLIRVVEESGLQKKVVDGNFIGDCSFGFGRDTSLKN